MTAAYKIAVVSGCGILAGVAAGSIVVGLLTVLLLCALDLIVNGWVR